MLSLALSACYSPAGGEDKPELSGSEDKSKLTGKVTINNTAPEVGDTLTAVYSDGNGSGEAAWQWFVGETAIADTNSDTYKVTGADLGKTLKVRVSRADQSGSVTSDATGAVSENITRSIDEITEALASQKGTQADPLSLKIAIDLGLPSGTDSGWRKLLAALAAAGDYVELDLTACTMTGNTFDHDNRPRVPGMNQIVKITLPDAIATIGDEAFDGCTALTEVSFPQIKTIGLAAFGRCMALAEVSLPKVKTIGWRAFASCRALRTITLGDSAPTVGYDMFFNVTGNPTITVKIPARATGHDKPGTVFPKIYNETANHTPNWANGFRGKGWDGTGFISPDASTPVILRIEYQ